MTTMAVIDITGSTDGIGRAAARVLLADGHRVLRRTY
jgi:NAD(P)-dependent dehydrogenase (short-subunit alcohol dehydrogenase family)